MSVPVRSCVRQTSAYTGVTLMRKRITADAQHGFFSCPESSRRGSIARLLSTIERIGWCSFFNDAFFA